MNNKSPTISAKDAFESLNAAGFPQAFVKRALPDWWDNALLKSSAGVLQFASILKVRLGLEVSFAQDGQLRIQTENPSARFKRRSTTQESELHVAATVGLALARLAIFCTREPYVPLPSQPQELRVQVKQHVGRQAVDFEGLLDFCWARGVPVLFLKELPKGGKRVAGIAIRVEGRPAIVLGLNSPQNARQLFVLAHELAHICLGHILETGALIDEGLSAVTDAIEVGPEIGRPDKEEKQADTFALAFLRGGQSAAVVDARNSPTAAELASACVTVGRQRGIDPGHLILSYAAEHSDWLSATLALRYFPNHSAALELLRDRFIRQADLDRLTDENKKYLLTAQGFA